MCDTYEIQVDFSYFQVFQLIRSLVTYFILLGHSTSRVHPWEAVQVGYVPRTQKN